MDYDIYSKAHRELFRKDILEYCKFNTSEDQQYILDLLDIADSRDREIEIHNGLRNQVKNLQIDVSQLRTENRIFKDTHEILKDSVFLGDSILYALNSLPSGFTLTLKINGHNAHSVSIESELDEEGNRTYISQTVIGRKEAMPQLQELINRYTDKASDQCDNS